MKNRKWVVIVNYFMIFLFLLAAGFQFNDFDAAIWILIYGAAALSCVLWRWSSVPRFWYILAGVVCLAWMLYLLFSFENQFSWNGMFDSIQMKNNSIEIIREIGGLVIIAIWMFILSITPAQRH